MIKQLLEKLNFFKRKDPEVLCYIYVKAIDEYYCIFKDGAIWNIPYKRWAEWKKKALRSVAIVLENVTDTAWE